MVEFPPVFAMVGLYRCSVKINTAITNGDVLKLIQ
jgi:hypothetical protein